MRFTPGDTTSRLYKKDSCVFKSHNWLYVLSNRDGVLREEKKNVCTIFFDTLVPNKYARRRTYSHSSTLILSTLDQNTKAEERRNAYG